MDAIATSRPDIYVGAGINARGADGSDAWIRLRTELPAGLQARVDDLPLSIDLQVGGGLTAQRQEAASRAMLEFMSGRPEVVLTGSAESGYDESMTGIQVTFARTSPDVTQEDLEAVVVAARAVGKSELGAVADEVPVDFEEVNPEGATVRAEETIKGGHFLWHGGESFCTSGFTGRNSGGALGVITAQHCPRDLNYEGGPDDELSNGVVADSDADGRVDMQFHRTLAPHNTVGKFFAGDGEERTVAGLTTAMVGTTYCHYGIDTAPTRRCDNVTAIHLCRQYTWAYWGIAPVSCGLAKTDDWVSGGGDSGGPWFYGSRAVGIHAAGGEGAGSYFTMIHKAANNLGVAVLQ